MRYGVMMVGGKVVSAHRFSWEIHDGPIPDGMLVLHKCDVPSCVNPGHLFLGTYSDNMKDAANKGRLHMQKHPMLARENFKNVFGDNHPSAKLTALDALKIRDSKRSGWQLGRQYGLSKTAVNNIKAGKTWARAISEIEKE